jgi:hypothetical protein
VFGIADPVGIQINGFSSTRRPHSVTELPTPVAGFVAANALLRIEGAGLSRPHGDRSLKLRPLGPLREIERGGRCWWAL